MDMPKRDVEQWIREEFPYLQDKGYEVTSPETDDYNCIAWALDDTENWWWPDADSYWPAHVDRDTTLHSFIEAFRTKRYEPCRFDERVEETCEKIVLFIDQNDMPTHAAKQLGTGTWTSKLGRAWDIEHHALQGVECNAYGRAQLMFSRPKTDQ
jgi:hypothetical protein